MQNLSPSKVTEITYGVAQSPFGLCVIGMSGKNVCWLSFVSKNETKRAENEIKRYWKSAHLSKNDRSIASLAKQVFSSVKKDFPLVVHGTPFQIKVWQALSQIKKGNTRTYGEVARAIKHPKAVRAVGTACGRNPIAYLIPCHRVLASDGTLGGYRWGVKKKKEMLTSEQ